VGGGRGGGGWKEKLEGSYPHSTLSKKHGQIVRLDTDMRLRDDNMPNTLMCYFSKAVRFTYNGHIFMKKHIYLTTCI